MDASDRRAAGRALMGALAQRDAAKMGYQPPRAPQAAPAPAEPAPPDSATLLLMEQLQILFGARNPSAMPLAAPRLTDFEALLLMPDKPQSRLAGGSSVSVSEFNALVRDVRVIFETLAGVSRAMNVRLTQAPAPPGKSIL